MNRSDPKQSVRELLVEAHPALIGLSHWIHANPEVGFEEHHASDWVNEWLQTAGFEIERGVADMPTALVGRFGPGPFHVAICVEYDALPEVGHACGHNVIAAAGVGAGLALASVADELGLRVSVMGTPAEESGGGKLAFIEAGLFDDVHAAAMVHPWPSDVVSPNIIAITQLDVTYRGHEAHAAGFPHLGRNAADALVVAQTAIGLLRQQLLPTDRVHGIVTKGGDAPNIIPALTRAFFMVRAEDRERLDQLTALVRRCFEAGALATGTEVEVVEGTRYANMIHDPDLAALYRHNGEELGRVFDDSPGAPVSTDMGDVSHVVPSIHPMIGIDTNGAVNHQREFAEACATASADQAILDGALGLAWTVIDAAQNQVIRARLMGEVDIREAVAMVEEVQELDSQAEVLDDLAATVAVTDPDLAEHIAAAADVLESRADELADEADDRFEHAQELADEALLDEVTGEMESDVEDLVAAIEGPTAGTTGLGGMEGDAARQMGDDEALTEPIVELLAVVDVAGSLEEVEAEASLGVWEPARPETAAAEGDVVAAPEAADLAEAVAEPVEVERAPTVAATTAVGLDEAHAAWERDFLVIVRHAAWEEEFSGAVAAVAEPEPQAEAVAQAEPEPEPQAEAVAQAEPEPAAEPEWVEPVAEAQPEPEPVAEPEPELVAQAEPAAEPEWVEPVAEAEPELVAQAEPEPAAEPEWVEPVAEAQPEPEPVAEPEPELVAQAETEPAAEPEWVEPVAEAEPEPVVEPEPVARAQAEWAEPELVAQARAGWELPDAELEMVASADDIWYSGAPEDELPVAELLTDDRLPVAASVERDGFVWIPADDDR